MAAAPGHPPRSRSGRGRGRTTTASRPALSRARAAAEAAWSATASIVAASSRPPWSALPRRSSSGTSPAQPIATSAWPRRHARPKLSAITTAGRSGNAARRRLAEASGSTGSRHARSSRHVRAVHSGVRAHQAVMRAGDQHASLRTQDLGALVEHELNHLRLLAELFARAGAPRVRAHFRRVAPAVPRPSRRPSGSRPRRRRAPISAPVATMSAARSSPGSTSGSPGTGAPRCAASCRGAGERLTRARCAARESARARPPSADASSRVSTSSSSDGTRTTSWASPLTVACSTWRAHDPARTAARTRPRPRAPAHSCRRRDGRARSRRRATPRGPRARATRARRSAGSRRAPAMRARIPARAPARCPGARPRTARPPRSSTTVTAPASAARASARGSPDTTTSGPSSASRQLVQHVLHHGRRQHLPLRAAERCRRGAASRWRSSSRGGSLRSTRLETTYPPSDKANSITSFASRARASPSGIKVSVCRSTMPIVEAGPLGVPRSTTMPAATPA